MLTLRNMKPTITLNGTGATRLIEETETALDKIRDLAESMYQPNARDWIGDTAGFAEARRRAEAFSRAMGEYQRLCETVRIEAHNYLDLRGR